MAERAQALMAKTPEEARQLEPFRYDGLAIIVRKEVFGAYTRFGFVYAESAMILLTTPYHDIYFSATYENYQSSQKCWRESMLLIAKFSLIDHDYMSRCRQDTDEEP